MAFSFGLSVVLFLFGIFQNGYCIRCYECVARLGPGEISACLHGDESQLKRVHCIGPSVCAAYHYQSVIPGTPTINHITRGCQALRYGATCEDIFNELRMKNEILPGQHTCTTCSTDLCNSADKINAVPLVVALVLAFLSWLLLL
ncbi:uncharacterized protein LOC108903988 [Anoplophora glabripennis]|uniref:uncharacterized protein LOC108903988 n=1 Tax=Anoplophora glabripennis TaxID=217634 RepID=UPI0008756118|nr:uncharacterized protein LOC108903988 [Anoplophora glabripennis]